MNEENDLLLADATIHYYDCQLDVEFDENANLSAYRDAEASDEQPGYLYASVPVLRTIPDVAHVVLEHLYIPDDYDMESAQMPVSLSATHNTRVAEALVSESMKITGNEDDALAPTTEKDPAALFSRRSGRLWTPAGRIQV